MSHRAFSVLKRCDCSLGIRDKKAPSLAQGDTICGPLKKASAKLLL
jgi:hypothetical protein